MRNAGSHVYLLLKFECLWRDIDRYIPISLLVLIFSLDRGVPRRMTTRRSKGNDDFVSRVLEAGVFNVGTKNWEGNSGERRTARVRRIINALSKKRGKKESNQYFEGRNEEVPQTLPTITTTQDFVALERVQLKFEYNNHDEAIKWTARPFPARSRGRHVSNFLLSCRVLDSNLPYY